MILYVHDTKVRVRIFWIFTECTVRTLFEGGVEEAPQGAEKSDLVAFLLCEAECTALHSHLTYLTNIDI